MHITSILSKGPSPTPTTITLMGRQLASSTARSVSFRLLSGPSAAMTHSSSSFFPRACFCSSTARRTAGAKHVGPASFVEPMPSV